MRYFVFIFIAAVVAIIVVATGSPANEELPQDAVVAFWENAGEYTQDMGESIDAVQQLVELLGEVAAMHFNEVITDEELLHATELFRNSLNTHIDYFEEGSPPASVTDAHRTMLEAWRSLDASAAALHEGIRLDNGDYVEDATELMEMGERLMQDAQAQLSHNK